MIDAAWDWAKSRNLWRVNPIHKEDEIKVIVDDFFKYSEEEGIETQQIGTMEMQDYSSSTVNCNCDQIASRLTSCPKGPNFQVSPRMRTPGS